MYREAYILILILAYELPGPDLNRRWFRDQDLMLMVAFIWHENVRFRNLQQHFSDPISTGTILHFRGVQYMLDIRVRSVDPISKSLGFYPF